MAILISSHNLAELDNLCNKVCIIKNGSIVETSEISKIKKEKNTNYKIFEVDNVNKVKNILEGIEIIDENKFKIDIKKQEVPEIVKILVKNGVDIYEISKEEKTLEQAFFEKTGGNVIE